MQRGPSDHSAPSPPQVPSVSSANEVRPLPPYSVVSIRPLGFQSPKLALAFHLPTFNFARKVEYFEILTRYNAHQLYRNRFSVMGKRVFPSFLVCVLPLASIPFAHSTFKLVYVYARDRPKAIGKRASIAFIR